VPQCSSQGIQSVSSSPAAGYEECIANMRSEIAEYLERVDASVRALIESNATVNASLLKSLAVSEKDRDLVLQLEARVSSLGEEQGALRDELQALSDASYAARCTALRDLSAEDSELLPKGTELLLHGPMEKVGSTVYMHRRTFDENGNPLRSRVPVEVDGAATVSMSPQ
jgi:hypothetical protein